MRCFECKHIDLQSCPDHFKTGFGRCEEQEKRLPDVLVFEHIFQHRDCREYESAAHETVRAREVAFNGGT